MIKFKCLGINIFLILLFIVQRQALAQILTAYEVKQLQAMSAPSRPFDVHVLADEEDGPSQTIVIVGVDYARVDEQDIKSIKNLQHSFQKIFIQESDITTVIGKEIGKNTARCNKVLDSDRLKFAQINWGLPTMAFGGAAVLGSVWTYYYPNTINIISTLFAAHCAQDCYATWKYKLIELRSRSMVEALCKESSTTKILAFMDKVSARVVTNKLIKLGKVDHANILHEQLDQDGDGMQKPKLKPQEFLREHADAISTQSDQEFTEEAVEKMEQWEKARQRRMVDEEERARAERVQQEWKKNEKRRR